METARRPKIGLALSGSGDRTTFYIGFLEILQEHKIPIDYITACSGGSLVASALACDNLSGLKKIAFSLEKNSFQKWVKRGKNGGGVYSLELVEDALRKLTKGRNLEEVIPKLAFVAVDIESGEKVILCMGDIAKAATISCTLPGLFEPTKWGNRTLVDGGLLSYIPLDVLKNWNPDITIAVNLRGTRHIFSSRQISLKRAFNFLKKTLFIDQTEKALGALFNLNGRSEDRQRGIFSVWAKSLDLAISASAFDGQEDISCDLMITPSKPNLKKNNISRETIVYYYEMGRQCALENIPKILELIMLKSQ